MVPESDIILEFIHRLRKLFELSPVTLAGIKSFLIFYYYGFLTLLFILWSACLAVSLKYFYLEMKKISQASWLKLLMIFNLALIIRFFVLPHHPQVFFDETTFIETAENYYRWGLNMQNYLGPSRNELLVCSTGWPFLISLLFRFTGVKVEAAFALSAALSTLSAVLIFVVAAMMFKNEQAGLWSSFIYTVYPIFCRISTSSAMESSSIFFIFLSLLAIMVYLQYRKTSLLYFSFLCLSFLVNIRQETFVTLIPLLLIFFFMFHPKLKDEFKNIHFYLCCLFLMVFSIPPSLASIYGVATNFYYFYEPPDLMRQHILTNLQFNITYWIDNRIHPLSVTLMALVSLWLLLKEDRRLGFYMVGWFLFLHGFYSINPSCDFSSVFTLDSWRTAAHPVIVLILLSGLTPSLISSYFKENYPKVLPVVLFLLILIVMLIPLRSGDFITRKSSWAKEYIFIKNFTRRLPPGSRLIVDGDIEPWLWESYMSMFSYNSAIKGKNYQFLNPIKIYSARNLFKDLYRWKYLEKRHVYLYLTSIRDLGYPEKINWFRNAFRLKLLGGIGIRANQKSYMVFEITGVRIPPPIELHISAPKTRNRE